MLLLVDNYDSFAFNLERYFVRLGQQVDVVRNDNELLQDNLPRQYSGLVLSPGPKRPQDAGHCLALVKRWSGQLPILGVCLGHQVIYEAFGGKVIRARQPVHGKATSMVLSRSRLFAGIPDGTAFARYHSLIACAESVPAWLDVTARTSEGEIMAVEHKEHPTFGIQFHPESVLSHCGYTVLRNFLHSSGLACDVDLPTSDLRDPEQLHYEAPAQPVSEHVAVLPPASPIAP